MSKSLIHPNALKDVYHKLIFTDDSSGALTLKKSNSDPTQDDLNITQLTVDIVGNVNGTITGNTSGTHTGAVVGDVQGDITGDLTGNADTVTQGVYKVSDQTIGGVKTFSETIIGNLQGNVTGDITGNVGGGDFTGNPIADIYISSASTWNSKQASHSSLANFVTLSTDGSRGSTQKLIISTGADTYAAEDITDFAVSLFSSANYSAARTTLKVDPEGTDNSTDVTIAAGKDYITLSGQELTLRNIDLGTDVTGSLADDKITSATTWHSKLDSSGTITNQDYAKFNAGGDITGVNTTELKSDLGLTTNSLIDWTAADAGDIHLTNLPAIAITSIHSASSEVMQLALVTQEGDVVVRTDENQTYIKNSGVNGTMSDFTLLATPTDAVTSVDGATGVITLNHDTLTGFITNEHIDWTAASAGTIDPTNIAQMGSGNSYAAGLVPAGSDTHLDKFLRKDGSWEYDTYKDAILSTAFVLDKSADTNGSMEFKTGQNGSFQVNTGTVDTFHLNPNSKEFTMHGSSTGAYFRMNLSNADMLISTQDGESTEDGDIKFIAQGSMFYNANLSHHVFLIGGDNAEADFITLHNQSTRCSIDMYNTGTDTKSFTIDIDPLDFCNMNRVKLNALEGDMFINIPTGKDLFITENDGAYTPASDNCISNKKYVDDQTSQLNDSINDAVDDLEANKKMIMFNLFS